MSKLLGATMLALLICCDLTTTLAQTNESQLTKSITSAMVKRHTVKLADDSYEGRGAGYAGEQKAAVYIAAEFKKARLKPVGDSVRGRRSYFQAFRFHPRHPTVPWALMNSQNVLGFIEGTDPILKSEIVVIGAHYDGQGRTGQADPSRSPTSGNSPIKDDIWNSANDNAASVAAILEIARAITSAKIITKRSILFVAFGAEEHGMAGSIHYVNHPVFPLSNHVAMINLEKLGRAPDRPFSVNGSASSTAWNEVLKVAQEQTKTQVRPNVPFALPDSDHYPFSLSKIPAVMFYVSSNVDEAHQASDSSDKIDFERTAEAARFALSLLLELATRPNRPQYAASPIPDLGIVAHLASSEEADAFGLSGTQGGLKVTGVIAGLPAAVAGLQPGDFIYDFANYQFRRDDSVMALMKMYREILEGKSGNNLAVKLIRDKKKLDLNLQLRR
jgi:Peptidase family M28